MAKLVVKFRCPHCRAKLKSYTSKPKLPCPECGKDINLKEAAAADLTSSDSRVVTSTPNETNFQLPAQTVLAKRDWIQFVALGIVFGLLLSVVLDALRDTLGLQAFVYVLVGLLAFAILASVFRGLIQAKAVDGHTSALSLWFVPNLRWTSIATTAALATIFPIFVAECLGPQLGFIKGYSANQLAAMQISDQKATQASDDEYEQLQIAKKEQAAAEQKKLISEFAQSHFILANPSHRLVGIVEKRVNSNPVYQVTALANGDESAEIVDTVLSEAWNARIPVVAEQPRLARQVYETSRPGQFVSPDLVRTIREIIEPKKNLPVQSEFVSFVDNTTGKARFAQVVGHTENELTVCDLVPMRKLLVPSVGREEQRPEDTWECERIDLLSMQVNRNLTDHQLKSTSDFLEYAGLKILQTLEQQADVPSRFAIRPSLYVDDVSLSALLKNQLQLDLEQSLVTAKSEHALELRRQLTTLNYPMDRPSFMEEIRFTLGFLKDELEDKRSTLIDQQKAQLSAELIGQFRADVDEIKGKIAKYERVSNTAVRTHHDLTALLGRAGIEMVDRSEKARHAYSLVNGDTWVRASAQNAVEDDLVKATHLLLPEISLPDKDGSYEIHLRLIDVRTGVILWNDNGQSKTPSIAKTIDGSESLAQSLVEQAPPISDVAIEVGRLNESHVDDPAVDRLNVPFSSADASAAQLAWAQRLGIKAVTEDSAGVGIQLILIPPGEFLMGSDVSSEDSSHRRKQVTIERPFLIGKFEVTQKQWTRITNTAPWKVDRNPKIGSDYSASHIDGDGAAGFCSRLSNITGQVFRLPTEAEWEYACRAGSTPDVFIEGYYETSSLDERLAILQEFAWLRLNAGKSGPNKIGLKKPNSFGLYDVYGNVAEWCNETDVENNDAKVRRGGGFRSEIIDCSSVSRKSFPQTNRSTRSRRDYDFENALSESGIRVVQELR